MYRVEMLERNGNWEPVGNPVEDSDFPSMEEAEDWIAENIAYRVDENASRGEYRITIV